MMRGNHVVIVVLGKMRVQAIAGLRGFSVPDAIRKNDVVARGIEKLARAEEFTGKNGRKELLCSAPGAMQNQDRIGDASLRVARGLAERGVVKTQIGERFTRAKLEMLRDKVASARGGRVRLLAGGRRLATNANRQPA